jgi:hypothetical protein
MAATYPEDSWMPKGPNGEIRDGKLSLGCTPFSVSAAELPTGTPQWADFRQNWDEDTIKKGILSMNQKVGEEFMSAVSHTWWERSNGSATYLPRQKRFRPKSNPCGAHSSGEALMRYV